MGQAANHLGPWWNLEGKVVMVTGASSGIGREICLDLAKAGCRIVAAARRIDRLNDLCNQINGLAFPHPVGDNKPFHVRAVAVELDVSADGEAIEASVQKSWEAFGCIHALINNAGIRGGTKSPVELCEQEWDIVMKTNVRGAWLVSKYVCRRMRNVKLGGSIINISSTAGANCGQLAGATVYSSSKTALNTMTKVMAVELGGNNIRFNSVSPGLFKSEITERLMQKKWFETFSQRTIPLKTHGTVDPALTSIVRYLVHDSSSYVTGNIFIVDAGATLTGVPIFSSL